MKVQVTEKVKGECRIPIMDKTFGRGRKIDMSEDQFFDSATQWMIRAGYLTIIEDAVSGPSKPRGDEFRLVSKNCLTLRCVGRSINPDEVFYVPQDKLDDGELALVLDRGMVVKESDFKKSQENKTEAADAVEEVAAKEEKPVEKTVITKTTVSKENAAKNKIPESMHVHVPEAVKNDVKPKTVPGRTPIMLDLDEHSKEDEMSFVDAEQTAAKLNKSAKTTNVASNNDEVI